MKIYHPKGGMCGTCVNLKKDCSGLDFSKMRPISEEHGVVVVKCDQHQKPVTR